MEMHLITNVKEVPLLILTADCVPVVIIDPKNKAIGVAHAGWRGTYDKIAKNTIENMIKNYNTNPRRFSMCNRTIYRTLLL